MHKTYSYRYKYISKNSIRSIKINLIQSNMPSTNSRKPSLHFSPTDKWSLLTADCLLRLVYSHWKQKYTSDRSDNYCEPRYAQSSKAPCSPFLHILAAFICHSHAFLFNIGRPARSTREEAAAQEGGEGYVSRGTRIQQQHMYFTISLNFSIAVPKIYPCSYE